MNIDMTDFFDKEQTSPAKASKSSGAGSGVLRFLKKSTDKGDNEERSSPVPSGSRELPELLKSVGALGGTSRSLSVEKPIASTPTSSSPPAATSSSIDKTKVASILSQENTGKFPPSSPIVTSSKTFIPENDSKNRLSEGSGLKTVKSFKTDEKKEGSSSFVSSSPPKSPAQPQKEGDKGSSSFVSSLPPKSPAQSQKDGDNKGSSSFVSVPPKSPAQSSPPPPSKSPPSPSPINSVSKSPTKSSQSSDIAPWKDMENENDPDLRHDIAPWIQQEREMEERKAIQGKHKDKNIDMGNFFSGSGGGGFNDFGNDDEEEFENPFLAPMQSTKSNDEDDVGPMHSRPDLAKPKRSLMFGTSFREADSSGGRSSPAESVDRKSPSTPPPPSEAILSRKAPSESLAMENMYVDGGDTGDEEFSNPLFNDQDDEMTEDMPMISQPQMAKTKKSLMFGASSNTLYQDPKKIATDGGKNIDLKKPTPKAAIPVTEAKKPADSKKPADKKAGKGKNIIDFGDIFGGSEKKKKEQEEADAFLNDPEFAAAEEFQW